MTDFFFYNLANKQFDIILPKLLEKCYKYNWKVYIQCKNKILAECINKQLWTYKINKFLPHGIDDSPLIQRKNFKKNEFSKLQPILIGTKTNNPNFASVRFLLEGSDIKISNITQYKRIIILFNNTDKKNIINIKLQWKKFKSLPKEMLSNITYLQQISFNKWKKYSLFI